MLFIRAYFVVKESLGRLTTLDVEVKDVDVTDGVWTIQAQSEYSIVNEFRAWLEKATDGKGSIEELAS
ncbi:MAG: hypothetical protein AMS22_04875 [Thiotrichales bacterium SG8_50]|nr:MAG: hypothetical protein AMS22_04875 [Thiotrichales bacterium SG8_50]